MEYKTNSLGQRESSFPTYYFKVPIKDRLKNEIFFFFSKNIVHKKLFMFPKMLMSRQTKRKETVWPTEKLSNTSHF